MPAPDPCPPIMMVVIVMAVLFGLVGRVIQHIGSLPPDPREEIALR